jgi:hypothetical protein
MRLDFFVVVRCVYGYIDIVSSCVLDFDFEIMRLGLEFGKNPDQIDLVEMIGYITILLVKMKFCRNLDE